VSKHGGPFRKQKLLRADGVEQIYGVGSNTVPADPAAQTRAATSNLRSSTQSLTGVTPTARGSEASWREQSQPRYDKYRAKYAGRVTKRATKELGQRFAGSGVQLGAITMNPESYDARGNGNDVFRDVKDDPMLGWAGVRAGEFAYYRESMTGSVSARVGDRDVTFEVVHNRRRKIKFPLSERSEDIQLRFRGHEVTPRNVADMVERDANGTFDEVYRPPR
jgi:hypothetical protein